MNTYFYLHSYVFLWRGHKQWLLFDALHRKQLPVPRSEIADYVFDSLLKPLNHYSIKIDKYLREPEFKEIIQHIEKRKMGGIHSCNLPEKPIIVPPGIQLNNQSPFKLKYLREITIHLSGECSLSCKGCGKQFRQFPYCTKNRSRLNEEQLRGIRANLAMIPVEKMNIIINDSRDIDYYVSAFPYINNPKALCVFHIHWRHATADFFENIALFQGPYLIKILVDLSDAAISELRTFFDEMNTSYSRFKERAIVVFCFSESKARETIKDIINLYAIENYETNVYYNGNNTEAIRSMYFMSDRDLSSLRPTFKDVLANRVMNKECFGKIVIFSDGTVHLNENTKAIGKVTDSWKSIIQEAAMRKDSPWLSARSRVSEVCRSCEYRFLCPPVSNVEMFMKSSFACSSHSNEVANK